MSGSHTDDCGCNFVKGAKVKTPENYRELLIHHEALVQQAKAAVVTAQKELAIAEQGLAMLTSHSYNVPAGPTAAAEVNDPWAGRCNCYLAATTPDRDIVSSTHEQGCPLYTAEVNDGE